MTKIQWCNETWNPVTGCTRVSRGCQSCYAERLTYRLGAMGNQKYDGLTIASTDGPHWTGEVRCHEDVLLEPIRWRKPRMIFVNSMSDTFHPDVPFEFLDKLFAVMALCPQHTFQVLTKRPERMAEYLNNSERNPVAGRVTDRIIYIRESQGHNDIVKPLAFMQPGSQWWPLLNLWPGTSCEDQATLEQRVPHLLRCPAAVRFLSLEPLLGPISFGNFDTINKWSFPHLPRSLGPGGALELGGIHQVIAGGESGRGARPCNVEWFRSIRDQCRAAGVALFLKQLGRRPYQPTEGARCECPQWTEHCESEGHPTGFLRLKDSHGGDMAEWPEDLRIREFPKDERSPK